MSVATQTKLRTEHIKPKIGSRILNTKEELLSGDLADEIREEFEARGVIVIPGIHFTEEEQIAFTKTLGQYAPENPDGSVSKITLDVKENPSAAEYLKGSLYWHIDGTRNDVPILASMLSCKVPSPKGTGNTGFSNTYAAYEALSDADKAKYDDMKVLHAPWASLFYYEPEPPLAKIKGMQAIGEKVLPLVWEHKSGRKSLVLGCTAHHVLDVDHMESAQIIHGLREWATGPDFTYSHEWEPGDLVIWDNTGTMHRAEWYDVTSGRLMVRTKLEGEEPFA